LIEPMITFAAGSADDRCDEQHPGHAKRLSGHA
jgi:hypothetical protein